MSPDIEALPEGAARWLLVGFVWIVGFFIVPGALLLGIAALPWIGLSLRTPWSTLLPAVLFLAAHTVSTVSRSRRPPTPPRTPKRWCGSELDHLETLSQAGSGLTGLSTGLTDLDELTEGLQPGNLVLLAARPGLGKSALGVNIATHASHACQGLTSCPWGDGDSARP